MLRVILLIIANFSLVYTDLSSGKILNTIFLPLIDFALAGYLFWEVGIYVMDNIDSFLASMQNPLVDLDWQNPRYFAQYTLEVILWCVMFWQYMVLFKKAILS